MISRVYSEERRRYCRDGSTVYELTLKSVDEIPDKSHESVFKTLDALQ